MSYTLSQLAQELGLEFEGPSELVLERVCSLDEPVMGGLAFAESKGTLTPRPSILAAVICHPEVDPGVPCLRSAKPRYHYAKAASLLHPAPDYRHQAGVHPTASVDDSAQVHPTAFVGPFCVIGAQAVIEQGAVLQALVAVGANSLVGREARLLAGVFLGENCRVGESSILDARARLNDGSSVGPQTYVGANSVLDGAQMGSNVIMDNLACVGRNTQVGQGSILISKSAVGKNATLGMYNLVAAVSVVCDMVTLANFIQVAGYSVVYQSFEMPKSQLGGDPAGFLKDEVRERAMAARAHKCYKELTAASS